MRSLALIAALICAGPARAEFASFSAKRDTGIDFCASGVFTVFVGDCRDAKDPEAVSVKSCDDAVMVLNAGLAELFPYAKTRFYRDLEPREVFEALVEPNGLGFFMVGAGDAKGGFRTGGGTFYPDRNACAGEPLLFGGIYSHSKYSPDSPAPSAVRGKMLSRTDTLYGGGRAAPGSWPALCGHKASLVYPTRTFAGRAKPDLSKFIAGLYEEKKAQVLKALADLCPHCPEYVRAGHPLAKLCAPNSRACAERRLSADSAKTILENYCLLSHPEYIK